MWVYTIEQPGLRYMRCLFTSLMSMMYDVVSSEPHTGYVLKTWLQLVYTQISDSTCKAAFNVDWSWCAKSGARSLALAHRLSIFISTRFWFFQPRTLPGFCRYSRWYWEYILLSVSKAWSYRRFPRNALGLTIPAQTYGLSRRSKVVGWPSPSRGYNRDSSSWRIAIQPLLRRPCDGVDVFSRKVWVCVGVAHIQTKTRCAKHMSSSAMRWSDWWVRRDAMKIVDRDWLPRVDNSRILNAMTIDSNW